LTEYINHTKRDRQHEAEIVDKAQQIAVEQHLGAHQVDVGVGQFEDLAHTLPDDEPPRLFQDFCDWRGAG